MEIKPFTVDVSDAALADLVERLARAKIANDYGNADWRYGFNGDYLRELVAYWLSLIHI